MSWKSYITGSVLKKLGATIVSEVVIPIAKDFVKKTDNKWDDKAVEFIEEFLESIMTEGNLQLGCDKKD